MAILHVLWERGPQTVRDVHDALRDSRGTGYTTVLKLLQIMTGKRLVAREELGRAHLYRALPTREQAERSLVGELIDKAFGGSAQRLVMQALSSKPASPEEIAEIRRLLDSMEGGQP
jgi:predicted transcriptional regulator